MAGIKVSVAEAHNHLSALIDQALAGVDVVIAKRSKPVVRLVPVDPLARLTPGQRAAALAERLRVVPAARRASEQIEAELHAERASWR
ncbi:MAG: type II toxin-antitoxin system prevent-host-death family antitoxin [Bifidobacteriaceae bacterium]|jgi:prevent-host-death family protein|nr:type II toxin-antitoxin system prevent-host-death family antitoxin [Bifidobacteriaceae bacterium]